MAGTVTLEEIVSGPVKRITFTWTADSSGNATKTTANSYTGSLTQAVFTPGSPTPTTLYDVTLVNSAAADMLGGAGANLTVTGPVLKVAADGLTSVSASTLSLSISNAGNVAQGVIVIYVFGTANAYCTLSQIKQRLNPLGTQAHTVNDGVINEWIEQASRAIDGFCGGRTFYARTETHYFDATSERQIDLDDDLLTVTTLTNGDATVISSTDYNLIDKNHSPYFAIRLKQSSSVMWTQDSDGNTESAISLLGTWGCVDRTATDARSVRYIQLSEAMTIETVLATYQKRWGENATGTAIVTAAGVVITPEGLPETVKDKLMVVRKGNG